VLFSIVDASLLQGIDDAVNAGLVLHAIRRTIAWCSLVEIGQATTSAVLDGPEPVVMRFDLHYCQSHLITRTLYHSLSCPLCVLFSLTSRVCRELCVRKVIADIAPLHRNGEYHISLFLWEDDESLMSCSGDITNWKRNAMLMQSQ